MARCKSQNEYASGTSIRRQTSGSIRIQYDQELVNERRLFPQAVVLRRIDRTLAIADPLRSSRTLPFAGATENILRPRRHGAALFSPLPEWH